MWMKRQYARMTVSCITLLAVLVVYAAAVSAGSLIEPAELKTWVDNGYRTKDGQRVVIIDVMPNPDDLHSWFAGDAAKLQATMKARFGDDSAQYQSIIQLEKNGKLGHIPGSLCLISHADGVVANRNEGPMVASHQVGDAAHVSAMLQKLGVTQDDVLVLTSSQQIPWMVCGPRLWWTLYYWGFSPDKLKLLNGSTQGYADAGYPLEKGGVQPRVRPSTFSVDQLPSRHLQARVSLQEMISMVDSGATTNGSVYLLDVRQPPFAYYLKDERKADGTAGSDGIPDIYQMPGFSYDAKTKRFTRSSDKAVFNLSRMLFSPDANDGKTAFATFDMKVNPPIPLPNRWLAMHSSPREAHLAIPLSARDAAFEGMIKGAHLAKTPQYNITVPALAGPDHRYKSKDELLKAFAKAGIDGAKPIVIYCQTGAVSSFYFYVLHEVCGFTDVRMYDGSWLEWGNMTAFEPADAYYVRHDAEMVFPAYPSLMPVVGIFDGHNNYLEWDGSRLVDTVTGEPVSESHVKLGGHMKGNMRWDTLHRSEHVVFRASEKIQDPNRYQTFNRNTDWLPKDTAPDCMDSADMIGREDAK